MVPLKPKDKAPQFKLKDRDGKSVALQDFKGKHLLLYFYPKASTSGCTAQACSVQESLADLKSAGCAVVGISPDTPDAQKKFANKYGLEFPLLSDPDHSVADAYGVWGKKSMYGREYEGIIRSAFLISPKGEIVQAWYKISPKDTASSALKALA